MRKFEKISDLLEEYTELCNPLLDAVLKTLGIMHESSLPFALELMIAELLYKQSSGDTCIRADAKSVNSFFKDIFTFVVHLRDFLFYHHYSYQFCP